MGTLKEITKAFLKQYPLISYSDECVTTMKRSLIKQAEKIGPSSAKIAAYVWAYKAIQSYQSGLEFLKLSEKYSYERFEKSCERALFYKYETAEAVELVLQKRLETLPLTYCTDIFGQQRIDS